MLVQAYDILTLHEEKKKKETVYVSKETSKGDKIITSSVQSRFRIEEN